MMAIPGRPRAAGDHPDILQGFSRQLQGVEQGGQRDHRGPMLVVVEDRDIAALLQPFLDFKAAGSGDIL